MNNQFQVHDAKSRLAVATSLPSSTKQQFNTPSRIGLTASASQYIERARLPHIGASQVSAMPNDIECEAIMESPLRFCPES